MRHADSMLTALTDEEIDAGLDVLRSQPSKVGRMELTLFVFERPLSGSDGSDLAPAP